MSSISSSTEVSSSGFQSLLSITNLTMPLAAIRPSAWEPEENLWPEAPTPSPAVNRPFTVVMER